MKEPQAKKIRHELDKFNDHRIDNYFWLRERDNPEVTEYLEQENSYCKFQMQHTEQFQEDLFLEMKSRIKEDDSSIPYRKNGYYYQTKFRKGDEYPVYVRFKGSLEANEEILFDVNKLAEGFAYYNLGSISISPDNTIAAYSEDNVGRRVYNIRFKNLLNEELLDDYLENVSGSCVWSNCNKYVFYTKKDEQTLRSNKIFRHKIGSNTSDDELIFNEEDETFSAFVYKTKSQKFIVIGSSHTLMTEYQLLEADNPTGNFRLFHKRENDLEYSFSHYKGYFYIHTNHKAKNFKIMRCGEDNTHLEAWEEFIPHREEVMLQSFDIFANYLVLEERTQGLNRIRVMSWDKKEDYYIGFDEDTYSCGVGNNPDFETDKLIYNYTSLTSPFRVTEFDMGSREEKLLKEQIVLGDFDKTLYKSERLWANGRDGSKIPISVVYKKSESHKPMPTLLYGYGAYGIIVDASFSSLRLSLLDRGFAFAIAHIRGGEYLGRKWYEEGKMLNKINTFNDFIDCSEFLINNNYAKADALYASGGSAGGLLMGAIINMRPDLYKGILAAVPFVDVLSTMLDETIPLTTGEYDEWGNPNIKQYYDYIKSYSPYDNVKPQNYPNMLVTCGLHDTQVQYWEPAKWVAKLRELKTDNNKLLLHTNMDAGHIGASGRFEALKELALEYAFILDLEGKIDQ